jgi:site-specific DNA-methyltransferase (adenine-specific)
MSEINFYNVDNIEFMKTKPDNYYDLAIVDPPYGIGESSNDNKSRSKLGKSKDYGNKNWDDNSPNLGYFKELKRVSKNQVIFGANHFIEKIPYANSSCWIVWNKMNGENDFADCELAYCSFKTAVRKVDIRWHGMLQHDMKNKEVRIHPTQKPVLLYRWIIDKYAKENDKILDTHGGSMTIAKACDMEGFDLDICEIDKEYFDNGVYAFKQYKRQTTLF